MKRKVFRFMLVIRKISRKQLNINIRIYLKWIFQKKVNWVINWCGKFMWWGLKK